MIIKPGEKYRLRNGLIARCVDSNLTGSYSNLLVIDNWTVSTPFIFMVDDDGINHVDSWFSIESRNSAIMVFAEISHEEIMRLDDRELIYRCLSNRGGLNLVDVPFEKRAKENCELSGRFFRFMGDEWPA